jgi:hypothetical protein
MKTVEFSTSTRCNEEGLPKIFKCYKSHLPRNRRYEGMDGVRTGQQVGQLIDCWMAMIVMIRLCPQTRPVVLGILIVKSTLDVQSFSKRIFWPKIRIVRGICWKYATWGFIICVHLQTLRHVCWWGHWIFQLINPSSRTMALGSTLPLTEMSTRNLPGSKGRQARKADNLTSVCEPTV